MVYRIDDRSKQRLALVYPDLATRANKLFNDMYELYRFNLKVTEGLRSKARQSELFAMGRTKPGRKVTNARKGLSFHNYGLACDLCFGGVDPFLDKDAMQDYWWGELGRLAEAHGLEWGGNWRKPDRPHIQMTYGYTIREIKKIYEDTGLRGLWATLDEKRGFPVGSVWDEYYFDKRIIEAEEFLG